ncbi:MAG TPA: hypothetical protein VFS95_09740 [Telluria sp.]|nr:hypothetical protein [Telluria sp.]
MTHFFSLALLTTALLLSNSAAMAAVPLIYESGAAPCQRNCGQTTQVGNTLLVTLVDKTGRAFKTETYPIDPNATRIAISPPRDDVRQSPTAGAHGPVTTRTARATITTPTQQVVISQIFYYSKGQLVDVRIVDQHFSKDI